MSSFHPDSVEMTKIRSEYLFLFYLSLDKNYGLAIVIICSCNLPAATHMAIAITARQKNRRILVCQSYAGQDLAQAKWQVCWPILRGSLRVRYRYGREARGAQLSSENVGLVRNLIDVVSTVSYAT